MNPNPILTMVDDLLGDALQFIRSDEPEKAAWRIVDAAGLLNQVVPVGTIGLSEPTGRGFQVYYVEVDSDSEARDREEARESEAQGEANA